MKKLITYFLFTALITACSNRDLTVVNAASKEWRGGIKNNHGVSYSVLLIAHKSSDKINIDKMLVNDKVFDVSASRMFPSLPEEGFKKNDSIFIYAYENIIYDENGNIIPDTVSSPQPFLKGKKGSLIIGYLVNNKRRYLIVDSISKTKPMLMP